MGCRQASNQGKEKTGAHIRSHCFSVYMYFTFLGGLYPPPPQNNFCSTPGSQGLAPISATVTPGCRARCSRQPKFFFLQFNSGVKRGGFRICMGGGGEQNMFAQHLHHEPEARCPLITAGFSSFFPLFFYQVSCYLSLIF